MTRCNEQTSHPASHVQPFKTSLKNVNSGMCFSTLDAGCSIALHTRRTVAKYKSKQNRVAIRLAIRTPWGGVDTWGLGFGFVIGTKKAQIQAVCIRESWLFRITVRAFARSLMY